MKTETQSYKHLTGGQPLAIGEVQPCDLGKGSFEHGREESNTLHCGVVPSSGLAAKGYGHSVNSNIKE